MSDPLHLDFETRSAADLKKVGAARYAVDPTTEIILGAYRFGKGPVKWWLGETPPAEVYEHVANGGRVLAHNAPFERAIWNARIAGVGHNSRMTPDQQDCTMARGQAIGLPASLDQLGTAIRAPIQKDKDGHRLMMRMCKPKKVDEAGVITWHTDPADLERLGRYCCTDVEAETCIDDVVYPLSDTERRVWVLDQVINDRGVCVDTALIAKAQQVVARAKEDADRRIWRLTGGLVKTCNQTAKIVAWLASRGIPCTSVADGETEELIAGAEIFSDDDAIEAINLRRASVKAFKFDALLAWAGRDSRVRGSLGYHRAHTGRWGASGPQFHNMKRLDDDAGEAELVQLVLQCLREPDPYGALEIMTGDILHALSVTTRAMVIAAPGHELIGGDFSNVEGRVAAWLAGEMWKLQAFRAYDAGAGPDLYKVTAGMVLGKHPADVTKTDRQEHGKVPELACGYQGALNAFKKMAAKTGLKIADAKVMTIVRDWRRANPMIVQAWRDLEDAVVDSVCNPGVVVPVMGGRVRYVTQGDFLYCRLPSGRVLAYAQPKCNWVRKTIKTSDGDEIEINKRAVSYWGVHQGRWMKVDLYGGALFNHVVQGSSRDLLMEAMFAVEEAGYPIVLHVHDELLAEVPVGFGSAEQFEAIMSRLPAWADGLPLVAKAWKDTRYVK